MPIPSPLFLTGQNLAYAHDAETVPTPLTDHARTMAQGIYQVSENFYVAVGYGIANMTMVVGNDGVLIIDCLETEEGPFHILYSMFYSDRKSDFAIIVTTGAPIELWDRYAPAFKRMATLRFEAGATD